MSIYYAQFIIAEENVWWNPGAYQEVARTEIQHRVKTQLFSATDAQHAYLRAVEMIDGFQDANNDGPGDRTNFYCLGICDLNEVFLGNDTLTEALADSYGVDVGMVDIDAGSPSILPRELLSLFHGFSI